MTRMAIVGTTALGVAALVALGADPFTHAYTGIASQTDSLGRQVPVQTLPPAPVAYAIGAGEAQAEPDISEGKIPLRIDVLGRRVFSRTNHPWSRQARETQTGLSGAFQPEAQSQKSEIGYSIDSLGRKVPNQTVSPLG